jgi:hypothetical protein
MFVAQQDVALCMCCLRTVQQKAVLSRLVLVWR